MKKKIIIENTKLVFGITHAIGTTKKLFVQELSKELENIGLTVNEIKLADNLRIKGKDPKGSFKYYSKKMDAGDSLRKSDIQNLAKYAIKEIKC